MSKKYLSLLIVAIAGVSLWVSQETGHETEDRVIERPNKTLTGRVVAHDGRAIEDALVTVKRSVGDDIGSEISSSGLARVGTDRAGRYRVQISRHIEKIDLFVSAPGKQAVGRSSIKLTNETLELGRIVMFEQLRIRGRVLDQANGPLVGATILLHEVSASSANGHIGTLSATTHSDELGRYQLGPLDAGDYRISAEYLPYSPSSASDIRLHETTGLWEQDIVFTHLVNVKGSVVDSSGLGLQGVNVEVRDGRRKISMDLSQSDGAFDLGAYPAGVELYIKARKSGFGHLSERRLTASEQPVHIMMERAGRFLGRAIDAEGEAVAELELTLVKRDGPNVSEVEFTRYDNIRPNPNGVFSIDNVPAGLWDLKATAKGFEPLLLESIVVEEDLPTELIELEFVVGRTIVGRIVDGSSLDGISGSRVKIYPRPRGEYAPPQESITTTETGRFEISDVTRGEVTIVASAPGYASTEIELDGTSEAKPLEIVLLRGTRLFGVLVLANDNSPVQGFVRLSHEKAGSRHRRATDKQGRFEFTGLRAGTYVINADTDVGFVEDRRINIGDSPIELDKELILVVEPGGDLSGQLLNLEHGALLSARVFANGPGGYAAESAVDQEGKYSFLGVPKGEISVTVQLAHGLFLTRTIEVASRGSQNLNFTFGQSGKISGIIQSNGQPVEGATVAVFPASPDAPRGWAVSSGNGEFSITGLAISQYSVKINGSHYGSVDVGESTVLNIDQ